MQWSTRHLSRALLAAALVAQASAAVCSAAPQATTLNGTYVGEHWAKLGQDIFRGIPFAQPPVGDLRFAVPQPLNGSWSGTRNATSFSASCVGAGTNAVGTGTLEVSEDCLTLNVIRPAGIGAGDNLPVLLWIYGGGFSAGSTSMEQYNQSWIVDRAARLGTPVIGVSINYRLGGFGWLWSKELQEAGASNLGLRDQRLALHWVQENIAAFGGDPAQVTIQGESAGGVSVGHHLVVYNGRNDSLFRAAIAQSGTPAIYKYYETAEQYQPFFDMVANATNCSQPVSGDKLACLKTVPMADLCAAFITYAPNENPYTPFIDGDMIKQSTTTSMKEGLFVKVPFLVGTNFDEGTAFGTKNLNTTDEFIAALHETTTKGTNISTTTEQIIAALWPDLPEIGIPATFVGRPPADSGYGLQWKRDAAYAGDQQLHSSRRLTAQTWARYAPNASLYSYHFNVVPYGAVAEVQVTHAVDIPFSFYNLADIQIPEAPASYKQLSALMTAMWISFAVYLTPNLNGLTHVNWPEYTLSKPQNLVFDANMTDLVYVEDDTYRAEAINFLIENYEAYWGR